MEQVKIKSIKKLPYKLDRYDLTINSTHNFFANGILIHNTSAIFAPQLTPHSLEPICRHIGQNVCKYC